MSAREDICPGCGHDGHAGFCDCGCLDDREFRASDSPKDGKRHG